MKLQQLLVSDQINGSILYLIIVLANIDYVGILDYALKAVVGSAVWLGFRLMGDHYSHKMKIKRNNHKHKQP